MKFFIFLSLAFCVVIGCSRTPQAPPAQPAPRSQQDQLADIDKDEIRDNLCTTLQDDYKCIEDAGNNTDIQTCIESSNWSNFALNISNNSSKFGNYQHTGYLASLELCLDNADTQNCALDIVQTRLDRC